jgi:hypothetical protein
MEVKNEIEHWPVWEDYFQKRFSFNQQERQELRIQKNKSKWH